MFRKIPYYKLLLFALLIVGYVFAKNIDSYENTSKDFDNHLSVGIGFGTIKVINFVQSSYDIKLSKNISLFGYLGLPTVIGSGLSWQQNYNHNGWMLCSSVGTSSPSIRANLLGISYQWQLGNKPTYFSIGISTQLFQYHPVRNAVQYDAEWKIFPLPIISVDKRFN